MGDRRRVSIEQCRRALGAVADDMSDSEIERMREQLYTLTQALLRGRKPVCVATFFQLADDIEAGERGDVEERAAILEFDGKLSRDQAERAALAAYLRRAQ